MSIVDVIRDATIELASEDALDQPPSPTELRSAFVDVMDALGERAAERLGPPDGGALAFRAELRALFLGDAPQKREEPGSTGSLANHLADSGGGDVPAA